MRSSPRFLLAAAAAALALAAPLGLSAPAHAGPPVPDCDVSCDPGGGDPGGGTDPGSGTGGGATTPVCPPGFIAGTNTNANWSDLNISGVNDVAAGADGSVWYITGTSGSAGQTVRLGGGAQATLNGAPQGGKRIAVDPQGNPWIVTFDGSIYRSVGGRFQLLPGAARDIGIGGNGAVWIIGTNSRNSSFQVWSWTGSSWVADPGSGDEIDVTANGEPMVNGADGKVWLRDGGPNQGWTQFPAVDISVFDLGLSPCTNGVLGNPGGSAMWFTGPHGFSTNVPPIVANFNGTETGPSVGLNSGPVVGQFLHMGQLEASHVAVDISGHVFAVSDGGACDCAGDLLERAFN